MASDSQTLAALGATCVDHSTATAGLHANQEAVGTGATCFGRLVGTFHDFSLKPKHAQDNLSEARDYRKLLCPGQTSADLPRQQILFVPQGFREGETAGMWFIILLHGSCACG
jgi:hypothetical protein